MSTPPGPTSRVYRELNNHSLHPVHIISGDLILHKRTLGPIKSLIYGIRRYDADRVAALYDPSEKPKGWKVEGYMSNKAKTYLADVHDHMEHILTSIEMFAGISENLIDYSFNVSFLGFVQLRDADCGLHLMTYRIDVITRDERGDENLDSGHCSICAVDGACWLLRASFAILVFRLHPEEWRFYAGYELRVHVVRSRKIRHLVR